MVHENVQLISPLRALFGSGVCGFPCLPIPICTDVQSPLMLVPNSLESAPPPNSYDVEDIVSWNHDINNIVHSYRQGP